MALSNSLDFSAGAARLKPTSPDTRLLVGASASRNGGYFRALAANVEAWMLQNSKKILMVTSALPGEGKSLVALNLAAALADASPETILLEADSHRASLAQPLDLARNSGNGLKEAADTAQKAFMPGLTLISADAGCNGSTSDLNIGQLRQWLEAARVNASIRFVVIDAPSILARPDAIALGRIVDAVLFVVAANRVPRNAVNEALESIKSLPIAGVVINRFTPSYSARRNLAKAGRQ